MVRPNYLRGMMKLRWVMALCCMLFCAAGTVQASKLLIPMDEGQANHLKAYGMAYWVLDQGL